MKIRKKIIKKNEFRKNHRSGHPSYVFAREGSEFKYLGITHAAKTKNVKNIQLKTNPNPKDKSVAFIRPKAEKDSVNNFSKKLNGWRLSKKDKTTIKKLIK